MNNSHPTSEELISAFRQRYNQLETSVEAALTSEFGDSVVLERLGDTLDDFARILQEVSTGQEQPICTCKQT